MKILFKNKLKESFRGLRFKLAVIVSGICGGWVFWKPRTIGIEPTNRCNLNCIMCPRRYWDDESNKLGDISIELFKSKILPFLKAGQKIILQYIGEPLLAEYFFDMLKECKKKGCTVSFSTNGSLLKKYAKELLDLETDYIGISIDAVDSLKNIRGVDIGLIADGIKEINYMKEELKKKFPILSIDFVAMEQNVSELSAVVCFASRLKIGIVNVTHVFIHSRNLINQSLFLYQKKANRYFREAQLKAKSLNIKLNLPSLKKVTKICFQPFEMMFIKWNGDVMACCADPINESEELKLGNLNEFSLLDLWNSHRMRRIRMAQFRLRKLPKFCKSCPLRVNYLDSHIRILKNG